MTACSNETVLWTVVTRTRAALGAPLAALDLFVLLRSLGEEGKRYSFSNPPLLLLESDLTSRQNTLFQTAAHGTGSDMDMMLSLVFAVFDDIWTYDMN